MTPIAEPGYVQAMARFQFAIYPPSAPGLPWLAITLDGDRPVDAFGCPSEKAAEEVLRSMRVRWRFKNRRIDA
jgi:hypothetical protein